MFSMKSAISDVIWKQIWPLCEMNPMLDVGQLPYNPWLKATHTLVPLRQWNNPLIFMYKCDEYCLATWIATTEGNQLLAFYLQIISCDHWLGTWLALTEGIGVGALGLSPICAEYGLETLESYGIIFMILGLYSLLIQ